MTENNNRHSLIMLHIAVMLFGLSGVIGKWTSVPSYAVAWGRSLCSACLLFCVMKGRKMDLRLEGKSDYMLALAGGIVLAVHWTTFFLSIKTASVAIGTMTFSAFPLFVTFIEPVVFHEKLERRDILLAMLLLVGVAVTVPELSLGNQTTMGIIWGLVSAATYAALSLINRRLSAKYDGMKVCFYQQSTVALVLLPVVAMADVIWTRSDIIGVGAIGIICTATAFSLFVSAQRYVNARTAGVVSGMETVYGIIFAAVMLSELPSVREVAGGIIILAAALASTLKGTDNG
ncbi:MAG: DMT family transporter [Clostridia bacterium]|nr:DMT family transporter [Clostridia bacterium]